MKINFGIKSLSLAALLGLLSPFPAFAATNNVALVKVGANYGVGYVVAKVGKVNLSPVIVTDKRKVVGGFFATVPIFRKLEAGLGTTYTSRKFSKLNVSFGVRL